ncbi:uncharacterized protein BDV14DRAFT_203851 [Aspergillus stella-maris]|uniref:uncharacterized protein n=1 Tax=Aspergillus stella-maris TaxID=1810926 RepID=UPI003CCE115B
MVGAGFLMPTDRPVYYKGSPSGESLRFNGHFLLAKVRKLIAPRVLPRKLKTQEVGVYWPWCIFNSDPQDRKAYIEEWCFLTELDGIKTIFVISRIGYIRLELQMDPERSKSIPRADEATVDVMVDLFDDQRMAELCSLASHPSHEDPENSLPKGSYSADSDSHKCTNCERQYWHTNTKAQVQRFWLDLHADELDESEQRDFFSDEDRYNPHHPWVMDKLAKAPEFRPAVVFTFIPVVGGRILDQREYEPFAGWRDMTPDR